jgi:hypothetical protein
MATSKKAAIKTKIKKPSIKKLASKPHVERPRTGAEDKKVTIDRRMIQQDRRASDRRQKNIPVAVERRDCERRVKVNRRRQIDPTTCERDYTLAEIEFMSAVEQYKRTSGRMFPTCSEILEVLQKLGYEKCIAPVVPPMLEPTLVPDIIPPLAAF